MRACVRACMHACVYTGSWHLYWHRMWILSAHMSVPRPKAVLRHEDRASLLHEYLFVRGAHAGAFLRSCAREFTSCVLLARKRSILILVRFTADRRWCIVSYVSIGILSLPRASIPSSARPSFPPALSFPPPSPPPRRTLSFFLFLSLFRSFTPAALTNAGYNSIVGHDPQGALTPRTYLASSITNWIKPDYLRHSFTGKLVFHYLSLTINLLKNVYNACCWDLINDNEISVNLKRR